jgi:autotransporter passenger strand-loop-strand repeat protein
VLSGGEAYVASGGLAFGTTVQNGGLLLDDGEVRIAGSGTLAGILAGSGVLLKTGGGGDLVLGGLGADFTGDALISGGTIELATSGALGRGSVTFSQPTAGSARLQIDAADAPAAGRTFSETISNFDGPGEDIDLRSLAFVPGASATVVGHDLVLTDGGKAYTFELAGGVAGAYPVLGDGHGGTQIDTQVALFAQTAATLAPSGAASLALASTASPTSQTTFLHAAASEGGGHT